MSITFSEVTPLAFSIITSRDIVTPIGYESIGETVKSIDYDPKTQLRKNWATMGQPTSSYCINETSTRIYDKDEDDMIYYTDRDQAQDDRD
jgi:hypothetical protein